jgi:hypothetical protein
VIKKNIRLDVRDEADVSSGYHHERRRCGKRIRGDMNPSTYFYVSIALD